MTGPISRRGFLSAAALGAGALLMPPAPMPPLPDRDPRPRDRDRKTVAPGPPCLFGVNAREYPAISPALAGITFARIFADAALVHGVPSKWPGNPATPSPPGCTAQVCFHPDPQLTVSGQLDTALAAYVAQAPAGSWLTAWPEANAPGAAFWDQPGASVPLLAALHARLHALVQQVSPQVRYGVNFATWPVSHRGQDLVPFVVPGMSWYGLDGYQVRASDTAGSVFGPAWSAILAAEPSARLAVCETNSAVDTTGAWFSDVWSWAAANGTTLFSTYWGGGTRRSYPFSPSAGYVPVLRSIAGRCAA